MCLRSNFIAEIEQLIMGQLPMQPTQNVFMSNNTEKRSSCLSSRYQCGWRPIHYPPPVLDFAVDDISFRKSANFLNGWKQAQHISLFDKTSYLVTSFVQIVDAQDPFYSWCHDIIVAGCWYSHQCCHWQFLSDLERGRFK